MEQKVSNAEIKRLNKIRIAKYVYHHGAASKQEIANALGFSMPTVLQRVKELLQEGVITEVGEYESTGGRKAKVLSVASGHRYSVGLDITRNHISFVLLDLQGNVIRKNRFVQSFHDEERYYQELSDHLKKFLDESGIEREKILGVGISIPGIVDEKKQWISKSHVLGLKEFDLGRIAAYLPYKTCFRNDANSAAYAELRGTRRNTIYLSLSNTVGGAIYMNGKIYSGSHFRSAEFGHMILVPGGKRCYCGKKGCMDSYCSAKVLSCHSGEDLKMFFSELGQGKKEYEHVWDEYLSFLSIAITNLRMAFDCDVILGGYVGGYLDQYMEQLEKKITEYKIFENDDMYVKTGRYKHEAAAIGAALKFVEDYFELLP